MSKKGSHLKQIALNRKKNVTVVLKNFALFGLVMSAFIALGALLMINSESNRLKSPPRESNWIQTTGQLIKSKRNKNMMDSHDRVLNPYQYRLVYNWGGKNYYSRTITDWDEMQSYKLSNGQYALYVNPKKPSQSTYILYSQSDIENRLTLSVIVCGCSLLLCFGFYILMRRQGRKLIAMGFDNPSELVSGSR